ncbi:hypothetical protein [Cyclobacterium sp.]|uniref:hypothetical protein n=1 Tax=Cyclobacterium sp. TaxID=1966343 RepID=UPI001986041C|nr:hypothetical protein [Cyclobacterium sp.]MBD3631278.1 hypothetical protein [Cyclobacterium sp.]
MTDISLIVMQLKNRQMQIDKKINQLIDQNLDPFPFERLEKGKKLIELIKKILQAIEGDDLILAGMHIKELEMEGLKLDLG